MLVMKYGGTSVGDARRVRESARITLGKPGINVMVVSACGGVTNLLLEAGNASAVGKFDVRDRAVETIHAKHENVLNGIGVADIQTQTRAAVDQLHASLNDTLTDIANTHELTSVLSDRLVSHGEKIMATMMAATIRDMGHGAVPVFTDQVLATDERHGSARPQRDLTRERAAELIAPELDAGNIVVCTGFIGFAPDGSTTTLGRGGSDYSATLLGAALDADEVQIWTDVPGMLSADPRKVSTARVIPEVTYDEAQELAHFGAKVLHPRTIRPAVKAGIPVRVLSTFQPTNAGTVVRPGGQSQRIKATTALKGLTMLTLDVPELEDLAGASAAVFHVLHENRVEIISVQQSSSRRAMTFILDTLTSGCEVFVSKLTEALGDLEADVTCVDDVAVVAAVGEGAANTPGALAQLLAVLSRANVPVLNSSQQSSNAAVVVVVPDDAADRAVQVVHDGLIGSARTSRRGNGKRRDVIGESYRVG
ncbi:MAG: aspartate kinase [Thermomicrobiales bacterium]|nr:aspartate kinase [Thermomicrobiales bacterium]MCO5217379.1 aspartate kinase [Thermomicrobiales bacterium]MCO5224660.1 aspartate kinase [Thermomicrobiales bacterium]MCO5226683.1 aspartate kinase [Thermomicrobiales bacterium]